MASLIPYFPPPTIDIPGLGPTPPFGLLVVTGIVIGWKLTLRQVDKRGIQRYTVDDDGNKVDWVRDLLWWTVVTGMVVAKLFDTVFYSHEFSLRTGLSSTGGFLGAAMGYFAFFYRHKKYSHLRVIMADTIVIGLTVAWIFGRMGCFVVHDHKGVFSSFPLAIEFPEGQRHDLGFYEMVFTAGMAATVYLLNLYKKWHPGFFLGVVGIMYGPVRFFLDFLRPETTDARYASLTPAQWGSAAFTVFGVWLLVRALTGSTAITHLGPMIDGKPVGGAGGDKKASPDPAPSAPATKKSKPGGSSGKKKKKRKKR